MAKMNYQKAAYQERMRKAMEHPYGVKPKPRKSLGFEAKYAGICSTCKVAFPVGTKIKYNIDDRIIHVRCPKKEKDG